MVAMPVPSRMTAYRVSSSTTARLAQLAVDGEHGDAVHDRPDEPRHQQRCRRRARSPSRCSAASASTSAWNAPAASAASSGSSAVAVDEAAEHHAVVRRVGDGEADVGDAHRLERRAVRVRPPPTPSTSCCRSVRNLRWRPPRAGRACRRNGGRARCARRPAARRFRAGSARRRRRRGWWRAPRRAARGAGCRDGTGGAACGAARVERAMHLIVRDGVDIVNIVR